MRSSDYDFLSQEDRQWIGRCGVIAVVRFLGLFAGVALFDDGSDGPLVASSPSLTGSPAVVAAPAMAATTAPTER
jgi:hypothetical protein